MATSEELQMQINAPEKQSEDLKSQLQV